MRTRNARLAAIHSLFRYVALRHPEHAAVIQRVLAIPSARLERNLVSYLGAHRSARADIHLSTGPHVHGDGKGRKVHRIPLLAATVAVMKAWISERSGRPADPLFATSTGRPLSRDAVERRIDLAATRAQTSCPSLVSMCVTAHTLRHTAAMRLLHAGADATVIALWLGHEQITTTNIYLHADMTIKENAIARSPGKTQRPSADTSHRPGARLPRQP